MVTIFDELASNIDRISESDVMEALYDNTELLDEMSNAQRVQMLDNRNEDGGSLGQYSKATEKYNKQRSIKIKGGDPIILKDTGDFQSKIYARIEKDKAFMDSKDEKTKTLKKKEGENILGLDKESLSEIQNLIVQQRYAHGIYYNLIRYGRT